MYYPPSSKKNRKIIDHLVSTSHFLLSKYPDAALFIGGDINHLPLAPILSSIPHARQIVTKPTRGDRILDVIITNIPQYYGEPDIVSPVFPDKPGSGVPSDHDVPVAAPLTHTSAIPTRTYRTVKYRPLPQSAISQFGQWITNEDWQSVNEPHNPSDQVELLQYILSEKVDSHFPLRTVRLTDKDKPFIT